MPRQQVFLGAHISGFGGETPTKHRIKDLSVTGARIDRAGMLKPGSTVLVTVGLLEAVGATVIWVKDDCAGLRFAQTIDPDAARSKTIIPSTSQFPSPKPPGPNDGVSRSPTAGWVRDMTSPYRR